MHTECVFFFFSIHCLNVFLFQRHLITHAKVPSLFLRNSKADLKRHRITEAILCPLTVILLTFASLFEIACVCSVVLRHFIVSFVSLSGSFHIGVFSLLHLFDVICVSMWSSIGLFLCTALVHLVVAWFGAFFCHVSLCGCLASICGQFVTVCGQLVSEII